MVNFESLYKILVKTNFYGNLSIQDGNSKSYEIYGFRYYDEIFDGFLYELKNLPRDAYSTLMHKSVVETRLVNNSFIITVV